MNVHEAIETIARATPAEHITAARRALARRKCTCGSNACDRQRASSLIKNMQCITANLRYSHLGAAEFELKVAGLVESYDALLRAAGLHEDDIRALSKEEAELRKA